MGLSIVDLQKYDPSLELIWPDSYRASIDSIGTLENLQDNRLYFIGSRKYGELFVKEAGKHQMFSNVGILLEKKLVEKIEGHDVLWKALKERASWMGQVKSMPLAMSLLSKVYYDRDREIFNDEVDGRQMGTSDIHPTACVAQNVFIGANVKIGSGVRLHPGVVVLSQSEIGEECELFPNVVIYPKVVVGKRVRIHAGSIIGGDGFGYNFVEGVHHKVWHIGSVVLEDDVEIGSGSCVDRSTFGTTRIGRGSKLDNHVHIGHNVSVGEGVVLCGQTGVGGSARVGDFTMAGGRVGIADNVHVGRKCLIAGGSIVTSGQWKDGSELGGHPARPLKEWLRSLAWLRKLSLKGNSRVD